MSPIYSFPYKRFYSPIIISEAFHDERSKVGTKFGFAFEKPQRDDVMREGDGISGELHRIRIWKSDGEYLKRNIMTG